MVNQAKAIYSYFCSYAGSDKTAFPKRKKILADLDISVNTYYRQFNLLKDYGYIQVEQVKEDGFFDRNIYTLMEVLPCTKYSDTDQALPCLNFGDTRNGDTQNEDIIKVTDIKNNSIYNNQSVCQDVTDGSIDNLIQQIRENINYDDLIRIRPADAYIMQRGGWGNDGVLKEIYRHALQDKQKEMTTKANDYFSKLCNTKYNKKK